MIQLMFEKAGDRIVIIIKNNEILFGNTAFGTYLAKMEGLHLSYEGVIREHPDLKEEPNWRIEAIKRFKKKIESFRTEDEKADYIIEDLRKHYFVPLFKQREGFRPERIK